MADIKGFKTRRDVINQDIIPTLAPDDDRFDVYAICEEAYTFDTKRGIFTKTVSDEQWWEIAAKYDHSV